MLSDILTGKLSSSLTCIEDSLEQSGHHLLKVFAQQSINRKGNYVHIFCYELPVRKMKHGLKNTDDDHVHIHDCFSDPCGWSKDLYRENVEAGKGGILRILQSLPGTSTKDCVILIDSLIPLIYNHGFTKCYRDLHSLLVRGGNELPVSQIVCLIHKDALPDANTILPQLRYLATSYMKIGPPTVSSGGKPTVTVTHKKPGGKIVKQVESYFISEDNKVRSEMLTPSSGSNRNIIDDADLPQDLTTFKLSLGHQEKQARSQLVLPYLRESKVFYQPDEADDWDEEDPDDDLDV